MTNWLAEFVPSGGWDRAWLAIGLVGQVLFFSRWLVQWMASERRKESVVPPAFWYFSLGGGLLVLAYGIKRHDAVLVLGQAVGVSIYVRNLLLLARARKTTG